MDDANVSRGLRAAQEVLESQKRRLDQLNIELPKPELRHIEPLRPPRPAKDFQAALSQNIADAEQALLEDEILAVYHTGSGELIFLREVDYDLPDLIILKGADAQNNRCTVLVNMHAVQIVLKAVKRPSHIERRPIGFATS